MQGGKYEGLIQAGKYTSYAGAGGMIFSGLTLAEWGVIVGIACWILGWIATQYWSWRKDKRERLESKQRMRYMNRAYKELGAGKWATWQEGIDRKDDDV